jgi:hypothetical protein
VKPTEVNKHVSRVLDYVETLGLELSDGVVVLRSAADLLQEVLNRQISMMGVQKLLEAQLAKVLDDMKK